MSTCKVFVPYGALGFGISEEAFEGGIALGPDIIASDAGSTDSGPYYLGTGNSKYSREAIKRDMRMMLVAANKASIPVAVGSSGTCGTDKGVDDLAEICREICQEEGINAKLTKIYTQQSPETMKKKFREGKIKPLDGAPEIDEAVFDEFTNIVALCGAEPFMKALAEGADIIICGRATDTAIIASYPMLKQCGEAASWHGAKTCECGCVCTTVPTDGGVFLTVESDSFTVQATAPSAQCTPYTISAHLLYENSDPIRLVEPGVVVDTSACTYEQLPGGKVLVKNTKIEKMPKYTMKLEGVSAGSYQTIILMGIRDREIMKKPDIWIENLSEFMTKKLDKLGFAPATYSFSLRAYGWNAVYGGEVPAGYVPNEIGILLTITAETQALATKIAKTFNPTLFHFPLDWNKQMPSFAYPFSPAEIERGRIYEFRLHHVVEIDDPLELVRFENVMIQGK